MLGIRPNIILSNENKTECPSCFIFIILVSYTSKARFHLIPMDAETQQNHLKAYGITFWALDR